MSFPRCLQVSVSFTVQNRAGCVLTQRDGYVRADCEEAVEGVCCSGGFLSLCHWWHYLVFKTQSSAVEVSDVLLHFFFFLAKLHISSEEKSVWFHNDLCSLGEMGAGACPEEWPEGAGPWSKSFADIGYLSSEVGLVGKTSWAVSQQAVITFLACQHWVFSFFVLCETCHFYTI